MFRRIGSLLNQTEIFLLPSLNPDGYAASRYLLKSCKLESFVGFEGVLSIEVHEYYIVCITCIYDILWQSPSGRANATTTEQGETMQTTSTSTETSRGSSMNLLHALRYGHLRFESQKKIQFDEPIALLLIPSCFLRLEEILAAMD